MKRFISGPTFEEMLHPEKIDRRIRERALGARHRDPLDPINLYNITWRDAQNRIYYAVIPKELTQVEANIVMLYSKNFPTGSHKVGAAYSVLMEKQLMGEVDVGKHTLVWPSTGNYGIGGAWVGCRMGFNTIVILPEEMSAERFQIIESYGARLIKTPGCESNVKEIYDKCKQLAASDPNVRILNQFEVFGNYRFHYYVTGNTIVELVNELAGKGIGNGRCAAFVSAMGSAGTIAAGDRLKQVFPETLVIGLEPIQCPTIFMNGYGAHDIQGIGDKHVTWIHNVMNMDAIMCIDDLECKTGLQLLTGPVGVQFLIRQAKIPEQSVRLIAQIMGISGVCNLLGAIKTAKYYQLGPQHVIVTIATDAIDRYHSVMRQLDQKYGKLDQVEAKVRLVSIFHKVKLDWIQEATWQRRLRWHNLKYYTWVEQQGKTVEELNAQKDPEYWIKQQEMVREIDRLNLQARREQHSAL
jgi:cysteine synthase